MRRLPVVLVLLAALAVAGCGGSEEVAPTAETVIGTLPAETSGDTGADTGGGTDSGGAGDPDAGKEVFASAGCGSCHTLADAGSNGEIGPNLDELQPNAELVETTVRNGKGAMPPFEGQLTDKQIQDVAAYVSSVAGQS
jgi:mono/diheme cytochrome c family protein